MMTVCCVKFWECFVILSKKHSLHPWSLSLVGWLGWSWPRTAPSLYCSVLLHLRENCWTFLCQKPRGKIGFWAEMIKLRKCLMFDFFFFLSNCRLDLSCVQHVSVLLFSPSRVLRKELLEFLSVFVAKLRGLSKPWLWSGEMAYAGDFTLSLTLNLNLTDSPQYYDLPILESTLQCLVELTAIPGFSAASKLVEPKGLCVELLTSLVQVCGKIVCFFHSYKIRKVGLLRGTLHNPTQQFSKINKVE